jgi:hypothetical protein
MSIAIVWRLGEKFEGLVRTSEEVLRDFDYFRELSLWHSDFGG